MMKQYEPEEGFASSEIGIIGNRLYMSSSKKIKVFSCETLEVRNFYHLQRVSKLQQFL